MMLSMELDPDRARTARANIERAGLSPQVNVMVGDAQRLIIKVAGPFDVIFQDGSKRLYGPLLDRLVELLRPGGILVTDNVLWDGDVVAGFNQPPINDPEDTRRDR
jgi:predicted O-methyltransferase YrrM